MLDTRQDGATPLPTHCTGLAEGALVMTLRGPMAVETLVPGDRILTRSGALQLHSVDVRVEPRARMVRISAAALGPDRPEADITLAADQSILVRDWRAQALTGSDRAMIPAARLADGEYIRAVAARDVRIFSLHFAVPAVIYAQGLELTCDPVMVPA
jgi:hypothetical protein